MKRLAWLTLVLLLSGCVIPFVHSHREKPHPPEAVQRFSEKAQALTRAPGAPGLPDVTRSMSGAIEALPDVKGGDRLALEVRKQADAMAQRGPDETDALARASLDAALEAVRRAKPSVPQRDKDQAVEVARQAIQKLEPGQPATINIAYREVARAMVVVTGGRAGAAPGSELSQLVARFSAEEPEDARRTGAQVIAAMGEALERAPHPPEHGRHTAHELRKRADRLAKAATLEYAGQLKDALSLVVGSLDRAAVPSAERHRLDEAKAAVDAIRDDRPLELQQAAAAAALHLVTDALTVSVSAR
jgi:hypothetical protein